MMRNSFTIEEVRKFWDGVATEYDRINSKFGYTHTQRFTVMQSYLPIMQAPHVLNVWSRTGGAVPYIREKYPDADIQNLEASPKMMERARINFPEESFAPTDLHDLPCENSSKDIIVSLETLEHVPDPLHFLLECHRTLKVGGVIIMSMPPRWFETPLRIYECFFENHGEGPHLFPKPKEVRKTLKQCGFELIEYRGTLLLPMGPDWLLKIIEFLQRTVLRHIGCNIFGMRQFFVATKKEERDPVWNALNEEVIRPGLSMHSGTAVGLSQGTLELSDQDGICIPALTNKGAVPKICYEASPEIDASYPKMNLDVFGSKKPKSILLGEYKRIAIAHSTDEGVRRQSASGGLLTALLLHLFESERIVGAVVLDMDPIHPWRAIPKIARTKEEVRSAAQSKYVVSPINTILGQLEKEEGPLAYIGLPHQVFAIRRLQQLNHPSVKAIEYVFGPFFGNELYGSSIDSFLRKFHAKKEDIVRLSYRAGEWPGHMQVELKNGTTIQMPKFHANYLIPFHITESSLLSHDLTNEFTDISGGDAWAPTYEERGKGFSLLIARSKKGNDLITEMERQGKLSLKNISESEAIRMQSHGLDLKKRGSLLRINMMKKKGKRVPEYDLQITNITLKRRVFEYFLTSAFYVCSFRVSRWIADKTPNRIIGPAFQKFRVIWKAGTKNIKQSGLSEADIQMLR